MQKGPGGAGFGYLRRLLQELDLSDAQKEALRDLLAEQRREAQELRPQFAAQMALRREIERMQRQGAPRHELEPKQAQLRDYQRQMGRRQEEFLERVEMILTEEQRAKLRTRLKRDFADRLIAGLARQLKLDDDQVKQIRAFHDEMADELHAYRDNEQHVQQLHREIETIQSTDPENVADIESKRNEIARLMEPVMRIRRDFMEKVASVLTPEQKELWRKRRPGAQRERPGGPRGRAAFEALEQVDLTDAQRQAVKETMQEYSPLSADTKAIHEQMRALRQEIRERLKGHAGAYEIRVKQEELQRCRERLEEYRTKLTAKIRDILTEEQRKKFDELTGSPFTYPSPTGFDL